MPTASSWAGSRRSSPCGSEANTSRVSPRIWIAATISSSSMPIRSCSPATNAPTRSITGIPDIPEASRSGRQRRFSRASTLSGCCRRLSSACCRAGRSPGSSSGICASTPEQNIHTRRRARQRSMWPPSTARMQGALDARPNTGVRPLEDLSSLKCDTAPAPHAPVYEQKLDAKGRAYATGKRKDAVARVWVKQGPGKITVNGKDHAAYFARPVLQMILKQPLVTANREGQYDIICTVSGGGLSGQAGAVRHGISKALTRYEPELRGVLKKGGFLTRDARTVERKKYGKAKARRSFQFSKR